MSRAIGAAADALMAVAAAVTLLLMVHVSADVFSKYVFNHPISGTLEIVAAYYMVILTFFSFAFIEHRQGHITVELFTRGMSARAALGLDVAIYVVFTLFLVLFVWLSFEEAVTRTAGNEMWETADDIVVVWPSRWILPASMAVMTASTLLKTCDKIALLVAPNRPSPDARAPERDGEGP